MIKITTTLIGIIFLASCASIDNKTTVSQRLDTVITAGVGDTIYKSTSSKNLPNAFGKADIFGRTTPTGTTTVIFEGANSSVATFSRRTIDIDTGATTMNSSPIIISNSQTRTTTGNIGGTPIYGQTNVQGPTTFLPPPTPTARYMDRNANLINVDVRNLPTNIVVEGMTIRILAVDGGSIRYLITKQE